MKTLMTFLLGLLAGCTTMARVGPIEVEPVGGAGFAGLRTWSMIQEPALATAPGCTGRCSTTVLADSIDLVPNHHYQWRPALSTGVTFQHYQTTGQKVGGGVGLNIVFVPGALGQTDPWPAITLHLGTHENGFFAGLVIAPTDGVVLPPGATSVRVQRDAIPDLVTRNTGKAGHLYFGIRLGGKSPPVVVGDTVVVSLPPPGSAQRQRER